ncbi:DnaJ domain [Macleaya cordata]|uniref:DnaJ domain n=1 Tax=Macleaya cordata TaxID=56857 RepID=A0A200QD38_MACCD|nr:DnaJ domain [Macleaya cordata]
MAVSSATATICISRRETREFSSQISKPGTLSSYCVRSPSKKVRFQIRGSAEAPQETKDVVDSESSVETSKVPYSVISTLNVEKVLRGIPITEADHYGRLGIQRGCPYDQVRVAYENKCEELMNQGLDEEDLSKKLDLLKESYSILSSEEERRLYDWSLSRTEKPDRYVWPFEADITQTPTQTPPPPEPEDVGPTRVVGYFMLGWLVLAFILSIALNR